MRASALGFDAYSSRAPGCSREASACVDMVGRAWRHGFHEVNSSSTWRVLLCPTWSPFSAYSVQIRTLAPIEKLLSSECSSTCIKEARPLELWISR